MLTGLGKLRDFAVIAFFAVSSLNNMVFADTTSPKDVYLKYRTAMLKANKIDELKSYLCKKVQNEIENTPAEMKPMMFGLMKGSAPNTVQVISEDVKGDSATLILTGKGDPVFKDANVTKEEIKGTIKMLREDGSWKIDKESWESKIEAK